MAHYYVKSPLTGKWFDAPYLGTVHHKVQAHRYWEGDPHLRYMVTESLKGRVKLVLRQVEAQLPTCVHGYSGLCPTCDANCADS